MQFTHGMNTNLMENMLFTDIVFPQTWRMDIFHADVINGVRMQVLSDMEIQDISGGRAFCSDSMSSSKYTATAGFWGGIGAGVMYAYNSYCSA
ncbi:hypothetical protein ACQ4WY_25010 [Janthinobacterium sp. LB2P49]|uniref:hypothetical protein n=1 Tax=Janthinobacterium sp. LB2P49 TaxID=3424198 RepID=UPI003F1E5C47